MLVLAIDTAGPDCAVALLGGSGAAAAVLARRSERLVRGHAERLMPMIEAALAEAGLGYSDIDRVGVTTGPGSFTGVRVGIAAARGLGLALDRPVVGVGSLDAIARPALRGATAGTLAVVLDARRGDVYALVRDIASMRVFAGPRAAPALEIAGALADAARPVILTGAGAALLAAHLDPADARIAGAAASPDIDDVAHLAATASVGAPPVPLYARGADARPQVGHAVARA